ncbi:hypothetical protein ACTJJ4_07755 [Microbacterium sp. 22195]|uniref:hypothetical protein n=1 Tax=Microbacterium sp. 22195 TaxID=3453891 RepID=UPI003F84C322
MKDWRVATVDKVARGVLWCARFVKAWLPRTLGGVSAFLLVLWGLTSPHQWSAGGLTIGISGVVVAVLAFFAEMIVQRPSYMKLSQLREEADRKALAKTEALENALRIMLVRLAEYCGLTGQSDRLSVYYFHDDEFVMVARHAKNPRLAKRGRVRYPAGQGVIGKAWEEDHGQALVKIAGGNGSWNREARKQNFTDAEIAKLTMRSVGLGGYRLEVDNRSVGVLIIESTTPGRILQEHLDKIAGSYIVVAIAELVAAFALMTPGGETLIAENEKRDAERKAAEKGKAKDKWQTVVPLAPPSK